MIRQKLTQAQRDHVLRLSRAGAIDRETGLGPYDKAMSGFSPMVTGKLQTYGLAASRVVRSKGGSQHTVYWLTPAGADRAKALEAEVAANA